VKLRELITDLRYYAQRHPEAEVVFAFGSPRDEDPEAPARLFPIGWTEFSLVGGDLGGRWVEGMQPFVFLVGFQEVLS
jgi:hypothetical protein